jgi:hypothetical protein
MKTAATSALTLTTFAWKPVTQPELLLRRELSMRFTRPVPNDRRVPERAPGDRELRRFPLASPEGGVRRA